MKALPELVIGTIIILIALVGLKFTSIRHDNDRAYVQALCDYSHTRNDGSLERRCGEAQDKTNTEYLCVTRSTDLNCWVEVK